MRCINVDVEHVPVSTCIGGLMTRRRGLGHNVNAGRWDDDILVSRRAASGSLGVMTGWILDASTGGVMVVVM